MKRIVSLSALAAILGACALNDPAQKVSVTAKVSSNGLDKGDSLDLTWTSEKAKSCSIADNAGLLKQDLPTAGKESFTPITDQTYTVSCEPAVKGDKGGSSSASVKLFEPPSATLQADKAQIFLGEQISLTWTARNAEDCKLMANGQELVPRLTLTGSTPYSPQKDTSYELSCVNARGKKVVAKTEVTVIPELAVEARFESLAALDAAIDIQKMKADCGPSCLYADFSGDFSRLDDLSFIASEPYKAALEKGIKKEPGKVALFTSKTVSFDFPGSLGYGHREAVSDAAQQKTCEQNFPFEKKGTRFPSLPTLLDELEEGRESLGGERQGAVAYDIEISGKALRGVMKKDSEAIVSYKLGQIAFQKEAAYTDFDKAKGTYRLKKDGTILLNLAPQSAWMDPGMFAADFNEEILMSTRVASFPQDGWLAPAPPAGVSANNYYPEPPLKNYFSGLNPLQDGCQDNKTPYYEACVKEAGETICRYERAQPINQRPGWKKMRSPRIVTALGLVQCNVVFDQVARNLGLLADWTTTAEQQYFVHDSTFPSQCQGANCFGKIARESESDGRFSEVEPASNRCINRWEGVDWNSYRATLQAACFSTQLYKEAAAKQVQSDNDAAFALACGQTELCKNAVNAMAALSDRFSSKALFDIIDREAAAMIAAKASGLAYFITEAKLSPQFISDARANLIAIESGLDTAQSIHADKKSGWTTANERVHGRKNIPGFDSYQESKDSIAAYKKQFDRVNTLTDLDMREISCSYDAKGRFRSYAKTSVSGNVMIEFESQKTVKSKVKEDTKISE